MTRPTTPIVVYTDGACAGNPGPGGWAWATAPDGAQRDSGGEAKSTNQRMEIRAVLEALRSLDGQLTIVSDSTYVINCFRDKWWVRWQANGWRNASKKPVANVRSVAAADRTRGCPVAAVPVGEGSPGDR
jgi:ribonuclease HI